MLCKELKKCLITLNLDTFYLILNIFQCSQANTHNSPYLISYLTIRWFTVCVYWFYLVHYLIFIKMYLKKCITELKKYEPNILKMNDSNKLELIFVFWKFLNGIFESTDPNKNPVIKFKNHARKQVSEWASASNDSKCCRIVINC